MHAAGEMLFGFIEENANRADTAGGRFINATVATGQSFFIPQGMFSGLILQHTWLFYGPTWPFMTVSGVPFIMAISSTSVSQATVWHVT